MFKTGSIRRIKVQNFVTYSHVEMFPSPNLNMIIGPNGTGKSTMVAAIILGLGGNPKTVGRGSRISEYVKHNCEYAVIDIFLQTEKENKFLKITREFDIRDRTTWKINDKQASVKEITSCVSEYNIQVNNLCQFLPQDRVQDFAKLNKQDLLRETQIALCRNDLIDKQNNLIGNREKHKECTELLNKYSKKLQEAQDQNVHLEGRVKNFNKKLKYQQQIEHIERKIAWTLYEEYRANLTEIKSDKNKAQEVYEKYKNSLKPIENEINLLKNKMFKTQQKHSQLSEKIRNSESIISTNSEKVDSVQRKLREIEEEIDNEIAQIQQWDIEIESSMKKLEEMKNLHKDILTKNEAGESEKQTISAEITKLAAHLHSLREKKDEIEQSLHYSNSEIRALESEKGRLENVKQSRFQALQRLDQQAFQAVLWLREHKHLFKNEIYEPMMLEINVLDCNKAVYVENCIPFRDRLAFTCVDKRDMNLLIKHLRTEQKLAVNVLHSGYEGQSVENEFRPDIPIERLRKFGFYTYVNSLFTAPDPIKYYLCKTYRLHNIPVGDISTNNCFESVPEKIQHFFSDKYRFATKRSKYSGQKSTTQVEVRPDGGLSMSLDLLRLEQLQGQINDIKKNILQFGTQAQNYDTQVNKINEKLSVLKEKLKDIQKQKHNAEAIDSRIKQVQRKIKEMHEHKRSPEDVRKKGMIKTKKFKQIIYNLQQSIKNEFEVFTNLLIQSSISALNIEQHRSKLSYVENNIKDVKRQYEEAEETLNAIKDKYSSVMQQAKAHLTKAKSLSKGFTPADDGFNEFRDIFDRLAADVQELNAEKENLLTRIACLNTADDTEMKEYEDRLKLIDSLTDDIEKTNTELSKISSKMDRLQEEWLTPLSELVAEINLKFAAAFERMGCAGEISICTGDNEKDYSQYGLCIKVTYRNGEPLQELNSNIQSGGERAVATAAFMLSLQELTPVPFRCVDEINQGMDATNERRIFELIVETTCQPNTSQYFLITPKLVPHLKFSREMAIHIVHNGPFIVQDRKWGFSNICNPRGIQIC